MAVVSQPKDLGPAPGSSGDVKIRTATEDDAGFVSRLEVYAFEDKMASVIGKSRFERFIEAMVGNFQYRKVAYHRMFIAEYQGKPAGLMEISYLDDCEDQDGGDPNAFAQALGCCPMMRLERMETSLWEMPLPDHCYLAVLCVADGFRGKGIGKALLDRGDWEARSKKCEAIYLHVMPTNRAKNLYERHGYECKGQKNGGCCLGCMIGTSKFDKMVKPLV